MSVVATHLSRTDAILIELGQFEARSASTTEGAPAGTCFPVQFDTGSLGLSVAFICTNNQQLMRVGRLQLVRRVGVLLSVIFTKFKARIDFQETLQVRVFVKTRTVG